MFQINNKNIRTTSRYFTPSFYMLKLKICDLLKRACAMNSTIFRLDILLTILFHATGYFYIP